MNIENMTCPIPISEYPQVVLAHGGGGKLMRRLIEKMFVPAFGEKKSGLTLHDSAVFRTENGKMALTTDSYVVRPLFFPGGDIGSLAVYGTVNDLAMSGAKPLYLTLGFILEEGLSMETLWRVVQSIKKAADETGVSIITGDTKVVDKGKGDGVFINTSGVGVIRHSQMILPREVRPGDKLLINGDLGRHGIAVMAVREGLSFETQIQSDAAPLADLVMRLLDAGIRIHCMRDLTRGGLASALNEIAQEAGCGIMIREDGIPVCEEVKGACEILGLDPLYVANEGRFAAFVASEDEARALQIMRAHELGREAASIGEVLEKDAGTVTMKSTLGTTRMVDMISGEQLPRIC